MSIGWFQKTSAFLLFVSILIAVQLFNMIRSNEKMLPPIVSELPRIDDAKAGGRKSSENTKTAKKVDPKKLTTIAYATSITSCQPDSSMLDMAAVLAYSIHTRASIYGQFGSKYDYDLYAFLHPEAANCSSAFEQIGWKALIKETPVQIEEIRGALKQYVHGASCCGEKEFLKLYSYTLTDYPIVTHLDLDVVVQYPLDDLYDAMILDGPASAAAKAKIPLQWPETPIPQDIEAFFTRDYNMVEPFRRKPHQIGMQGGFLVIKPSHQRYEEYLELIREGNYTVSGGWGGNKLAYGGYYGAAQVQGLVSFLYGHLYPNSYVELQRCYYNSMADSPRTDETKADGTKPCRTMEEECINCREIPLDQIRTFHLTICQKPHRCYQFGAPFGDDAPICRKFHHVWYSFRLELEQEWKKRQPSYTLTERVRDKATQGFCHGREGYRKITLPDKPIDLKR